MLPLLDTTWSLSPDLLDHLLTRLCVPPEIQAALDAGAPLAIAVSGGKDSDCMTFLLKALCQRHGWAAPVLVFANLGAADWTYTQDYLNHRAAVEGLALHIVKRQQGDLLERFWQNFRKRPHAIPWSSPVHRFCTGELKTGPTDSLLRKLQPSGPIVCTVGLRASESRERAKKPIWQLRESITTRQRTGYTWHPIHGFSLEEVWQTLGISLPYLQQVRERVKAIRGQGGSIAEAIQAVQWPWGIPYALGSDRLSCSICILSSLSDLHIGIEHNPDYYRQLVDLEIASGYSFRPKLWLGEQRPDLLTETQRQAFAAMRANPRPTVAVTKVTPPLVRSGVTVPVQLNLF